MKTIWRNILVFLILIIAIGAIFSSFNLETGKPKDIGISTLVSKIEADEVASIIVEGDIMTVTFKDESKGVTSKESRESLSELLANYGVPAEKIRALTIEVKQPSGFAYWFGMLAPIMLPIIILIAIIIGVFYLFNYLQTPKPVYVITEEQGQITVNPGGGEVPSGPPSITPPTYLPPEN